MPQFSQLWGDDLTTELGSNDTSVLFTDARRKHAVNVGLRQFADLTECFVKRSSITVSSSAQEFNLNSSSIMSGSSRFTRMASEGPTYVKTDSSGFQTFISGEELFPQRNIPYLDASEDGWRSTNTGDPTGWYLRDDAGAKYFGLDRPANVSTSETAELLIPFVQKMSSLTSDTAMPFAVSTNYRHDLEDYHQAGVHYAAHLMEKLRKDREAADDQLQRFMGYVNRYNAQKAVKGMKGVRMAQSYFRNARRLGDREAERSPWWR